MSKKVNNEEIKDTNVPATEEGSEQETNRRTKVIGAAKKYGSKVVKTIAVAAIGVGAFMLGEKVGSRKESYEVDEYYDLDVVSTPDDK